MENTQEQQQADGFSVIKSTINALFDRTKLVELLRTFVDESDGILEFTDSANRNFINKYRPTLELRIDLAKAYEKFDLRSDADESMRDESQFVGLVSNKRTTIIRELIVSPLNTIIGLSLKYIINGELDDDVDEKQREMVKSILKVHDDHKVLRHSLNQVLVINNVEDSMEEFQYTFGTLYSCSFNQTKAILNDNYVAVRLVI